MQFQTIQSGLKADTHSLIRAATPYAQQDRWLYAWGGLEGEGRVGEGWTGGESWRGTVGGGGGEVYLF